MTNLHVFLSVVASLAIVQTAPPVAQPEKLYRESVADLHGVRLFYVDSGTSGPPVVLLHAGTGSVRAWERQLPRLAAAGYRVIAYDRRGHGRTLVDASAPAGTAADDLEALRAHLGVPRFHLIGTAAGGIVATDYALAFGVRLRSLVIANSLVGVRDPDYVARSRRLRPPQFDALPADVRELGPSFRAADPEGTQRWLDLEHLSRSPGTPPPTQPPRSVVTLTTLETLTVPTLLITGDSDLYMPPPLLRIVADRIRHAETLILPGVGHSAYWEQPESFNDAVLAFIGRN
jgi:pimeloyl-ACP methyl ester carboxylesterase